MRLARLRAAAGIALLVAAGLSVGLVFSEVAYRVARRWVCIGGTPGFSSLRPWGWTHTPNSALLAFGCLGREFEWQAWVEINGQGLRDVDHPYEKPAGRRRVLLLGDSITEALQVANEHTFATLAEGELEAGGERVDVINAGHAGWGTDTELLYYRAEGARYASDLVLLVFNLQNDVLESFPALYRRAYANASLRFPPKPSITQNADGTLLVVPASEVDLPSSQGRRRTTWQEIASHFYLLRTLERAMTPVPTVAIHDWLPVDFEIYAPWDDTWSAAWRLTTELVRTLRREVEADGARFAVVVVPTREMVAGTDLTMALRATGRIYDLERPRRAMLAFLAAERIPYLDLFPTLRASATPAAPLFFTWDVHLNERGHAAAGPALASFIRERLTASTEPRLPPPGSTDRRR